MKSAASFFFFVSAGAAIAGQLADYAQPEPGVGNSGDGSAMVVWQDRNADPTRPLAPSGGPIFDADGAPTGTGAVVFDGLNDSFFPAGSFVLNKKSNYTAVISFSPDGNGESRGGGDAFNSSVLLGTVNQAAAARGFVIAYKDDTVTFVIKNGNAGTSTLSVSDPSGMVGKWWTVVASVGVGDGTTLTLVDESGEVVDQVTDPNGFGGALSNTGFSIGSEFNAPSDLNFEGKIGRIRLFDEFFDASAAVDLGVLSGVGPVFTLHTVTDGGDSGPGTLSNAVAAAMATTGGDLIAPDFDTSFIEFFTGGLEIDSPGVVRIVGRAINGNAFGPLEFESDLRMVAQNANRHFHINDPGAHLIITHSELRDGNAIGVGGGGGAIRNQNGKLTLRNCNLHDNTAGLSAGGVSASGGAISSGGTFVKIYDSVFSDNRTEPAISGSGGSGGAIIAISGDLHVERTDFFRNIAGDGDLRSNGGDGGAIQANEDITVIDCEFESNLAGNAGGDSSGIGGHGGAIFATNGVVTVLRSFFYRNKAGGPGLGIQWGSGGAIKINSSGPNLLENCTLHENEALEGDGSAVWATEVNLRHCTIVSNKGSTAVASNNAFPLTVGNSMIFNNFDINFSAVGVSADLNKLGVNWIDIHSSGTATGPGKIDNFIAEFLFGLNRLNGARTRALYPSDRLEDLNPIDKGTLLPDMPTTDQHGHPRVVGAAPDIGAIEMTPMVFINGLPSVVEKYQRVDLILKLTRAADVPITVTIFTEDSAGATAGEDFVSARKTITFLPGEREKIFPVTILEDQVQESPESINILLDSDDPNNLFVPTPAKILITGSEINPVETDFGSSTVDPPVRATAGPVSQAAGNYSGLMFSPFEFNQIRGSLTGVKVNASGAFSANLNFQGENFKLKGAFDTNTSEWSDQFTIVASGSTFQITLTIGQTGTAFAGWKIDGRIDEIAPNSSLVGLIQAPAVYFDGRTKINPDNGRYTAVFAPMNPQGGGPVPQSTGYGSISVSTKGGFTMAAVLPDGKKTTVSGAVSHDRELFYYKVLRRALPESDFIAGVLQFRDQSGVSDLDGNLYYLKAENSRDKGYPLGFRGESLVVGSVWTRPLSGQRALAGIPDNFQNVRFTFENENLPTTLARVVTWDSNNRILNYGPIRFTAKLNAVTGLVSGSYNWNGNKFSYGAALLQKQDGGWGSLIVNNIAGKVLIDHNANIDHDFITGEGIPTDEFDDQTGTLPSLSDPVSFSAGFAGSYYGNLEQSGQVTSFKVADTGAFSLAFVFEGETYVLKGIVGSNGIFTGDVTTRSGRTLNLEILSSEDQDSLDKRMKVTVNEGASLLAQNDLYRAEFNKKTNPAAQAGKYTAIINAVDAPAVGDPIAHGYASMTVDENGRVLVSGLLADRTKFSSTSYLSADAAFQLWANLYRTKPRKGYFAAHLKFDNLNSFQAQQSDASGEAFWQKFADPREKSFADGFDVSMNMIVSKYQLPGRGERALEGLADYYHNAELVLEENLPGNDPLFNVFSWFANNRATYYGPEKISIKINTKTGVVTGTRRESTDRSTFSGVIYQKTGIVRGNHVTNLNLPGDFTIRPR